MPSVQETRKAPSRFAAKAGYFSFLPPSEIGESVICAGSGGTKPKWTRFSVSHAASVALVLLANASELITQAPTFHFETLAPVKLVPWSRDSSKYISRCTISCAERNRT